MLTLTTLRLADNTTGYFGVYLDKSCKTKPYQAKLSRCGKNVHLGSFATAEEAALCVARSPEGRKAAAAARVPPLVSEEGDAGEEVKEENIEVLDAIEVDVWTDDGDDADPRNTQRGGCDPAHAARRSRQGGGGGGPAHAARRSLQGGERPAHAARCGCQAGARGRRRGALAGWPSEAAEK